ncbi:hypothetical protein [Pseudalkalibacillus sp. SCS-8]|uniref:hypothetical protein n=1 Tax=Pseudalkalibacillus nanhaiensis TaxID=3115291 RepID=UPI0032DAA658
MIRSEQVKRSFFEQPPASTSMEALVYVNQTNHHHVLMNGDRLTRSEVRHGKYHTLYRVDMSPKKIEVRDEFDSALPGQPFMIQAKFYYEVTNPETLVSKYYENLPIDLAEKMVDEVKKAAETYTVEEKIRVRESIADLKSEMSVTDLFEDYGIRLKEISVQVDYSQAVKDDYAKLEAEKRNNLMKKELTSSRIDAKVSEIDALEKVAQRYGVTGALLVNASEDEINKIIKDQYERSRQDQEKNEQTIRETVAKGGNIDDALELIEAINKAKNSSNPLGNQRIEQQPTYNKIEEPKASYDADALQKHMARMEEKEESYNRGE